MSDTTHATERTPLVSSPDAEPRGQDEQIPTDPPHEVELQEQGEEELKSRRNVQYTLPVLSLGIFLAFLDQSVVAAINGHIVSVAFLVRLPQRKSDISWREQLKRIDFLGAVLLILSIFALLFGLDRGTNVSWHSPTTLVSLCLTLPLTIAFLLVETKFALAPFTPGHVIFDRALLACYAQNFFGYAGFTALIFYLPLFFQVVLMMTPVQAGAGLIPAAISAVVGTFVGGLILKRIGRYYWLGFISASVAVLASIPIAIAPSVHSGSLIIICVASVASFVPQGIVVTASLIAILVSNVTAADQAVATASSFLFRSLGAAIGVSLVGLVIDQVLGSKLRAALDPQDADQILGKIKTSLDFIKLLRPELQITVRECYNAGIQSGFVMCSALLVMSAFCVIFWRAKKMS
ncbi:MAG: hypothetical protein LQ343_007387 [Gyalolechia ehrenbergii]|nr:MAG: hypothetical protein LQ343_007387 [Gyalolechia ehrenbergii]